MPLTLLASVVLSVLLSADPQGACPSELFRIERSKNANVVLYEARRGRGAALDPDEPVTASWLLLATHGGREPLSLFERAFAYGFEVQPAPSGPGFALTLKAFKARPIRVTNGGACPKALTQIDGREAVLSRIFIKADDRQLVPAVLSVEVFGLDAQTGEALYEKLSPDKAGR